MLRDMNLLPVYDSAEHDLVQDLIVPLLEQSDTYLRGVGFFTSGWLRIAAKGLVSLAERGGHAQYVVSPILEKEDWDALQQGEAAKEDDVIRRVLERRTDELASALENDTRNALAWLVADGVLEFRFAVPRSRTAVGDYHDKVGVFLDQRNDIVAIHGSFNDTVGGTLNGEAFSVFRSWDAGQLPFAQRHRDRLTKLWQEGNAQFRIRSIPDAVSERFIRLRTSAERPYRLPSTLARNTADGPHCPVPLRDFQSEAVRKWLENKCRGILEMATGTGKTVTALAAASERYSTLGRLALIVSVPYLHLLEQWARNCRQAGFLPILCSGEHRNWHIEAKSQASDFRLRTLTHMCLIAVHNTAATPLFAEVAGRIPPETLMLISDEAHALGAQKLQSALLPCANMRLGLTATPHRWYDEMGTEVLMQYFSGVAYEYPLERAIGRYLVPYEYHPIPVHLTEDEETEFRQLSDKIAALLGAAQTDPDIKETVELLLIKRARVMAGAREKLAANPVLTGRVNSTFMIGIMSSFAEFEREMIRDRIHDARVALRSQGRRIAGKVPFGYEADARTKQLLPDPDEAPQVRAMFAMAAAGKKPTEIAEHARAQGWRTKCYRSRGSVLPQGGGMWTPRQVLSLLSNPIYLGKLPDGQHDGIHTPLVDQETFEKARAQVESRRSHSAPRTTGRPKWPLQGILICGSCQRPMSTHMRRKGPIIYRHHRCRSHAGGQPPCPGVIAPAYELERYADGVIGRIDQERNGKAEASPDEQHALEAFAAVWGMSDEAVRRRLMAKVLQRVEWDPQASTVQVELNLAGVKAMVSPAHSERVVSGTQR